MTLVESSIFRNYSARCRGLIKKDLKILGENPTKVEIIMIYILHIITVVTAVTNSLPN